MASETSMPCKLCGAPSRFLCETFNEHGSIRAIRQFRCGTCGLVFVGNALTSELLGEAYATLDTEQYYAEVGKTEEKKFETCQANLRALGIAENSHIIDLGTGNGDFLIHLKAAGFSSLAGHDIRMKTPSALRPPGFPFIRISTMPACRLPISTPPRFWMSWSTFWIPFSPLKPCFES